jgi:hypothetical protein
VEAESDGGGMGKMSDEPLAREREPIERMQTRFEALVRANAAPRCGRRLDRRGCGRSPSGITKTAHQRHGYAATREAAMEAFAKSWRRE